MTNSNNSSTQSKRWTVQELLNTHFPEPKWAIPGLLPEGLIILAGRPKVGKSWLALQMAGAIGSGGQLLGRQVEQAPALYIALEDNARRLQRRLVRQGISPDAQTHFRTNWPPLDDGGIDELTLAIQQEGYRFVSIDTVARSIKFADQQKEDDMTNLLGPLQHLAIDSGTTILLVDHHRKGNGNSKSENSDPIDEIFGSTAKTGVADAVMGLFRNNGQHSFTLKTRGRDVEEQELTLELDAPTCTWRAVGSNGLRDESNRGRVLNAIPALVSQGETPYTKSIAEHLGMDEGNVSRELAELTATGQVVKGQKEGKIQPYYLPEAA